MSPPAPRAPRSPRIGLRALALPALSLLLVACADGPGAGPPTAEELRDYCEEGCAFEKSCNPAVDEAACVTDCVDDLDAGFVREDAIATMVDCMTSQPCGTDDDVCESRVMPLDYHLAYEATCRAELADCGVGPDVQNAACEAEGDSFIKFLTPGAIDLLEACLMRPCPEIGPCMQGVFADAN